MKKLSTLPFFILALTVLVNTRHVWAVLDTDGNQVRAGTKYYILPAVTGNGGGLTLDNATSCPLDVVQALDEANNGLPVIFSPADPRSGYVVMGSDSNIEFSAATICMQSTVWTVKSNSSTGQWFVTTGGVKGNPGRETLSNWFQIQQFDNAYKLVFCPGVCDTCRPYCGDLGIVVTDGTRSLVVRNFTNPLKVEFKKV